MSIPCIMAKKEAFCSAVRCQKPPSGTARTAVSIAKDEMANGLLKGSMWTRLGTQRMSEYWWVSELGVDAGRGPGK